MTKDIFATFPQLKEIKKEKFPYHLLIIPDGNGRWAKDKRSPIIAGHKKGYGVLEKILETLEDLPVQIVTVWGFAADNWKRSKEEVGGLMDLFEKGIKDLLPKLLKKNGRFIHLGRKDRIPSSLKKTIEKSENLTKENKGKIICIAIDFGGEDQELRLMRKVQDLPKNTNITSYLLKTLRDGSGKIPPADLIIRTSGENRTSDLGWLLVNSEFYSIKKLLPETSTQDFVDAVVDFSKRERRFGGRLSAKRGKPKQ